VLEVADGFGVALEYEDLPDGQIDRYNAVAKRNFAVVNGIHAVAAVVQIEIDEIVIYDAIVAGAAVANVRSPTGIDGIVAAEAEEGVGAAIAVENIVEGCAGDGCSAGEDGALRTERIGSVVAM